MQFQPGDKVRHTDTRVTWPPDATVIATSQSDPWGCAPGMVRVKRSEEDFGLTYPIRLLEKVG